ncbi:thymidylate synthase [Stenotrophomonas phage vB_SmaS-AXL_3]|uniref:thymidylate synthase n=1 Tax=Stenotrophomonas phage vB_SmaS-AXL_3 TaxID=2740427 RepID=A0A7D5BU41_9CAUD|nr:thymidylate synthase [Stenotrophomonas phage vB_SmaS-AXL_3]QKW95583.1 thymidylate synthase [Stenotrophomonas phage vB_SmaS-AXL_3]
MTLTPTNATRAWLGTIEDLILHGSEVAPRGQLTLELPQHTIAVDLEQPVVVAPTRRVSEKFLGAEAFWMLSGDNRVETIAPYNKNIAQFSDDGQTFFGAYGPKILDQLEYVVGKLVEDEDTRQAGLTLWRENPPATKDVPCTIAMFFSVRDGRLNSHVYMRSSDVWLGVPYDVFNFSMVAMLVLCRLNTEREKRLPVEWELKPGALYLTAASRHLYERNQAAALEVLHNDAWRPVTGPVPRQLWLREETLMKTLDAVRNGEEAAKWWTK